MYCSKCGKEIDEKEIGKWVAFDLQKGKEQMTFCSTQCLKEWISRKQIGMWTSVIIGVLIAIALLSEGAIAICLMFVPYMFRQMRNSFGDIFNSGAFGEFISIFVLLIGSLTVIYPAYKLIQEILEYRYLIEKYNL